VRGNSQALFGKRPTEKDPAKGTPPAVDFTRSGGGWKRSTRSWSPQRSGPQGKPGEKWLRDLTPGNATAPAPDLTSSIALIGERWWATSRRSGAGCAGLDEHLAGRPRQPRHQGRRGCLERPRVRGRLAGGTQPGVFRAAQVSHSSTSQNARGMAIAAEDQGAGRSRCGDDAAMMRRHATMAAATAAIACHNERRKP
jgi:hypothetical protein